MLSAIQAFYTRYLVAALVVLLCLSAAALGVQRHTLAGARADAETALAQRDTAHADIRTQNAGIELLKAEASAATARVHSAEAQAALVGANQKPLSRVPPGGCTPAAAWARASTTKAAVLENWR